MTRDEALQLEPGTWLRVMQFYWDTPRAVLLVNNAMRLYGGLYCLDPEVGEADWFGFEEIVSVGEKLKVPK